MGSRSKSKTTATTHQNETNISAADYSTGDGMRINPNIAGDGNSVTLNVSDQGAIDRSFEFASDTMKGSLEFANDSLAVAANSAAMAVDSVAGMAQQVAVDNSKTQGQLISLVETIKTDGQAQTTRMMTMIALALVGGVVVVVIAQNKGAK